MFSENYFSINYIGDDSKVDTPVPIPNTEVKHFNADGSKFNLARVGRCQALSLINLHIFIYSLFSWILLKFIFDKSFIGDDS